MDWFILAHLQKDQSGYLNRLFELNEKTFRGYQMKP